MCDCGRGSPGAIRCFPKSRCRLNLALAREPSSFARDQNSRIGGLKKRRTT